MVSILTTRGALLQALRQGPGYGSDLMRRVDRATHGDERLSESRVYPVLKQLEQQGLLRAWRVSPKGQRGARERIYYDLTSRGLREANRERAVLNAILSPPPERVTERERQRMQARLVEMDELSAFGQELLQARKQSERTHGRR